MSLHEYYSNPMDIVQFLEGEKAEKIMLSVLHSAALFHADTGLSPIVKSDKYDSYMLDYFFPDFVAGSPNFRLDDLK